MIGQLTLNLLLWSSKTHQYLVQVTELQLKSKYSTSKLDRIMFEDEVRVFMKAKQTVKRQLTSLLE